MRRLGTPTSAPSRRLLREPGDHPALDRVFGLLQQEYPRAHVDRAVAELLRPRRHAPLEPHRTLLRLSSNELGRPQIVTTNFDLLFERAAGTLPVHVGPSLPDIATLRALDGLVYLHGRLTTSAAPPGHHLVLGSADFGRAYLSDGWATRFIRELTATYTIVLVGYSASDPPVRYLLEGLHAGNPTPIAKLYAFDHGGDTEVALRWRGLGVRPLPYNKLDSAHAGLWSTLHAWATRATDLSAWNRSAIALAQRGPRGLEPFERGQVASLVASPEGAAEFAGAIPPPPAEWICVFDARTRSAIGSTDVADRDGAIQQYGLDSDHPRGTEAHNNRPPSHSNDASDHLALFKCDERCDQHTRLAGMSPAASELLPRRLLHIAQWFSRVAGEPAAIWWMAGYPTLHSAVATRIDRALQSEGQPLGALGHSAWSLFLQRLRGRARSSHEWYEFEPRLRRDGWNRTTLEALAELTQPYLSFRRPFRKRHLPRDLNGSETPSLSDLVEFSVEFPRAEVALAEVPLESLGLLLELLRRNLALGSALLAAIGTRFWQTTTFHPTEDAGDHYPSDASRFLHLVREVMDRLTDSDPMLVREDMRRWPLHDPYFFDKLRSYCWMHPSLATGNDAALGLLGLSEDGFWNDTHRREILHTLRRRWVDFSSDHRKALEERVLEGESIWEGEDVEKHALRRKRSALSFLGWLQHHGCALTTETLRQLSAYQRSLGTWEVSAALDADRALDSRVGHVATDTDPSTLLDVPIGEVLERASSREQEDSAPFRTRAPFAGLSSSNPRRALLVLSREARRGGVPVEYWGSLLENWPQETRSRLIVACCRRLLLLPEEALLQLRHSWSRWFRDHARDLAAISVDLVVQALKHFTNVLSRHGQEATRSALGTRIVAGGDPLSRRTIDHAINSPSGHLAEGTIGALASLAVGAGDGIPEGLRVCMRALLALPGEGADHARCVLSSRLEWLHVIDPEWTSSELLPLFDPRRDSAEPAWNGLLHSGQVPSPALFRLLRGAFLRTFVAARTWRWDTSGAHNKLVEYLLVACYWRGRDRTYTTLGEARNALRQVDDEARTHAISFLGTAFKENDWWRAFGRRFMQRAWPREVEYQSAAVSAELARLAERAGEQFSDVVQVVGPLLVPLESTEMVMFGILEEPGQPSLPTRFPDATIDLVDRLVPSDPQHVPYRLREILEATVRSQPGLRTDARWRRLSALTTLQ
jgi:hypothetical protein